MKWEIYTKGTAEPRADFSTLDNALPMLHTICSIEHETVLLVGYDNNGRMIEFMQWEAE